MAIELLNGKGQVSAYITGTDAGSLHLEKRYVNPQVHQLRVPPAWAFDTEHLDRAAAWGVELVVIRTTTGETWTARLDAFRSHGISIDRGHGRQTALPLKFWDVTPPAGRLGGAA